MRNLNEFHSMQIKSTQVATYSGTVVNVQQMGILFARDEQLNCCIGLTLEQITLKWSCYFNPSQQVRSKSTT